MSYISQTNGQVLLAGKEKIPQIYVQPEEEGIVRAAKDLCADFERVTGRAAILTPHKSEADIIVQMENSGVWESYILCLDKDTLVITGSDKRGTIYGIYDLSEHIGVSPWYWWADVPSKRSNTLYVTLDEPYCSKEPAVKYRGVFINDEESFAAWALNKEDYDYVETYKKVYELLLRLKANILWPAMHSCSPCFHQSIENAKNADLYGIIIGTSHCEQMMRNNVCEYFPFEEKWVQENPDRPLYRTMLGDSPNPCAYVYIDKHPDTGERVYNKEMITAYWREGMEQFGQYENIYTVGMRGLHDSPWQPVPAQTLQEKGKLLEEVIEKQREVLSEYRNTAVSEIPQIFVPYKEILEIYNAGVKVPDDVTLMWSNDNYGYIRQLPTDKERERSGGAGMYYHISYCGKPASYLWLGTTPFALIREEMTKAYHNGIDRIWVVNVGDIKAAERPMEYFLDLAWNIDENADIHQHIIKKAQRDFGFDIDTAKKFADMELTFERLAFARKPEHFVRHLFQLKDFNDEAMRYLDEYDNVLDCSQRLYEQLDEKQKAAYFELHLYALRSCRNTAAHNIFMDEQNRHIQDGFKNAAEPYIYRSDEGYCDVIADMKQYHLLYDGKWNHIMDSAYGWFIARDKDFHTLFECKKDWGATPGIGVAYEKMVFSGFLKNRRFIDIFNHYNFYALWKAETEYDWITLSKTEGTILTDERLWVDIDYEKAPKKDMETSITFTSNFNDSIVVPIRLKNKCETLPKGTVIEFDGYVSILAKNFLRCTTGGGLFWRIEPYLGRCTDSLKVYSDTLKSRSNESIDSTAVAQYRAWFETCGEFEAEIHRIPTLNERDKVRFAIGIDDDIPQLVECTNQYKDYSDGTDCWGAGVLQNCEKLTCRLRVAQKGCHTIKLYAVDSDVIIEKIIIWTNQKIDSYFGPEESAVR